MYLCRYIYLCICLHSWRHAFMCLSIDLHMCLLIYMYNICICVFVCLFFDARIHLYMCTYICGCIYVYCIGLCINMFVSFSVYMCICLIYLCKYAFV